MKFRPKCLSGKTQMAVDNRGRLLPCCYIDTPKWIQYPEIKKLLSVSVIDKNRGLEDILTSDEWRSFYEVLKQRDIKKIPDGCKHHCLDDGKDRLKVEDWFDDTGEFMERKGK